MTPDIKQDLTGVIPRLRRFCRGLTGNLADGDDLVQATCERVLLKAEQFEAGTAFDHWVFRIARNQWIDIQRQKARRPTIDGEAAAIEIEQQSTQGQEELTTELYHVDQAMQQLSEDQRTLILLICVEGLGYQETAKLLDLPIGTVMSRLARARKKLAVLMGNNTEKG